METIFGVHIDSVTREEWERAKGVVIGLLVKAASERTLTQYEILEQQVEHLTGIHIDKHIHMGQLIGELSVYEESVGRPLISAIVVRKDTGEPGGGFAKCADYVHMPYADPVALWGAQTAAVFDYWRGYEV